MTPFRLSVRLCVEGAVCLPDPLSVCLFVFQQDMSDSDEEKSDSSDSDEDDETSGSTDSDDDDEVKTQFHGDAD